MKQLIGFLAAFILFCTGAVSSADTGSTEEKILASMEFSIVGLGLKASPDYQAVPKGITSRVDTTFDSGSFDIADLIAQLPQDYTVRAELAGPAFTAPVPLVTKPGKPFDLPTLAVLGTYTVANIRMRTGGRW